MKKAVENGMGHYYASPALRWAAGRSAVQGKNYISHLLTRYHKARNAYGRAAVRYGGREVKSGARE